jgi:hypothetical protein
MSPLFFKKKSFENAIHKMYHLHVNYWNVNILQVNYVSCTSDMKEPCCGHPC